jgi:hypothetical protein
MHQHERRNGDRPTPPTLDIDAVRLRDMERVWNRVPDPLRPGDIVRKKRGVYSNSDAPTGLSVVLEVVPDRPVCDDPADRGSLGMRLDVLVGHYDDDGDFLVGWTDARRLELVPEDVLTADRRHVDARLEV